MRKMMLILAVAVVLGAAPVGQEVEPKPADVLREALQRSLGKGAVVFEGDCQYKMFPDIFVESLAALYGEGSVTGHLTARADKAGVAAVVVENDESCVEAFGAGGKMVQRVTWKSEGTPSLGGIRQLLNLVRLERITERIKDANDLSCRKQEDGTGVLVTGGFPVDLLGDDFAKNTINLKVMRVQLDILVGAEDGLVRKLEARVTRTPAVVHNIHAQLGVPPPPVTPEAEALAESSLGMHTVSTYTLNVVKYDAELKVEVPAELKKYMAD